MADHTLEALDIDMSDVQTFEPVPGDIYHVVIAEVKNQRKSNKNPENLCWDLILQVIDGEFTKRKLFSTLVYGKSCAGFMANFLEAIGLPWEKGPNFRIDPREWEGKMCHVEVIQKPHYKDPNKIVNEVKAFIVRSG